MNCDWESCFSLSEDFLSRLFAERKATSLTPRPDSHMFPYPRSSQATVERSMLQGPRVRLRGVAREDLPILWAFNNDLAVELASGGDPPYPQSLAHLQAEFDQAAAKGGRDTTRFVIEVDGKCVGICALFNPNTTARTCELGIGIGEKDYWGRGYGRDAIRLLLTYAFKYLNYRKVWLQVHAVNERAIRAYRACGFVEEGRQRAHVWSNGAYDDLILMGILRDEWQDSEGVDEQVTVDSATREQNDMSKDQH